MDFALQKNRGPMGRRYIEVFRSKKQDYYHAVAQAVSEPAPPDGFYGGGDGSGAPLPHSGAGAPPLPHGGLPGAGARAQQEHTGVLKMRGLPFSSTKDDIAGFFDDPNLSGVAPLSHDAIHIVTSLDGRPSGVAFVEFASAEEAKAAMIRDRQSMGTRYVELFPSSREEATRAATGGR
jgi:heterogeneous nuclear ribonucleoprotein F/H